MTSLAEVVLGISRLDEPDAVHKAYNRLTGSKQSAEAFQQRCRQLDSYDAENKWASIPLEAQNDIVILGILRQIFEERHIRYSNTLQHWPAYEAAYRERQQPPHKGQRWALQVGCYSPVTSAAFAALATEVYRARPLNIDLSYAQARTQFACYAVTNALQLGVATNSMHVVQTNLLLDMLKAPNAKQTHFQGLLSEMYRVLQPGGHVLLYEITPGLNFKKEHPAYGSKKSQRQIRAFKERMLNDLAAVGFVAITVQPGTEIKGVDYLFDRNRRFSAYPSMERAGIIMAAASKPLYADR